MKKNGANILRDSTIRYDCVLRYSLRPFINHAITVCSLINDWEDYLALRWLNLGIESRANLTEFYKVIGIPGMNGISSKYKKYCRFEKENLFFLVGESNIGKTTILRGVVNKLLDLMIYSELTPKSSLDDD